MAITVHNIGALQYKPGHDMSFIIPAGGVPAGSLIFVAFFGKGWTYLVQDTANNQYTDLFGNNEAIYAWNSNLLNAGDSINLTVPYQESAAAIAFYATGLRTDIDPIEYDQCTGAAGFNAVLATSGTPTTPGSLVVAIIGTQGPMGDSFTQDPAWADSPPYRIGTTGKNVSTNSTVAGGWRLADAAVTYAPVITKRGWIATLAVFAPAI